MPQAVRQVGVSRWPANSRAGHGALRLPEMVDRNDGGGSRSARAG